MRLLIVAQQVLPAQNPEAICTTKVIAALTNAGVECEVVTATENYQVPSATKVHVVPLSQSVYCRSIERLRRYVHQFPEAHWTWGLNSSRRVETIVRHGQFDGVYTRGMPFVSHLAGYYAKRPANVLWIAHFSDPWPQDDFWPDRWGWRRRWHRRVWQKADLLTYPCVKVRDYCLSQCGLQSMELSDVSRTLLVPHMSSKVIGAEQAEGTRLPLRFVHCGTFYGTRRPDIFVAGWRRMLELHPAWSGKLLFQHIGPHCDELQQLSATYNLQGSIIQSGPCSYDESLRQLVSASALVLIENANSQSGMYFPSKFADYVSVRRLVVALSATDGTIAEFLGEDYPYRANPWDVTGVTNVLTRAAGRLLKNPTLNDPTIDLLASHFTPESVAKNFVRELTFFSNVRSA